MTAYRNVWLSVVAGVSFLCLGLALVVWPSVAVFVLFAAIAVATGAGVVGRRLQDEDETRPRRELVREAVAPASAIAVAAIAVLVLAATAPSILLPVLVLALVTSPWVVGPLVRRRGIPPEVSVEPSASFVHDLSDRDLCLLWRDTFVELQRTTASEARGRIVAVRHACLDELQRRDPAGVSAWLATGPRAAGNPVAFLTRTGDENRGTERGDAA